MRGLMAAALIVLASCATGTDSGTRADNVANALRSPTDPGVFVVAHRACWSSAPENSLKAIRDCIALGVDIIEIDVRTTSDGAIVLAHDAEWTRTAGVARRVDDTSLAEVRTLRLRARDGGEGAKPTAETPPTLLQALEAAHGQLIVHLDVKEGPSAWPRVWDEVQALGMADQVLMKNVAPFNDPSWRTAPFRDAPLVRSRIVARDGTLREQVCGLRQYRPFAHTVSFQDMAFVDGARKISSDCGGRLWVSTHDAVYAAGLTDDIALADPDTVWGRLIDAGFTILETDTPEALTAYLAQRRAQSAASR